MVQEAVGSGVPAGVVGEPKQGGRPAIGGRKHRNRAVTDGDKAPGGARGDRKSAITGEGRLQRVPIHREADSDPDRLTPPVMVKLDRENQPGRTATTA